MQSFRMASAKVWWVNQPMDIAQILRSFGPFHQSRLSICTLERSCKKPEAQNTNGGWWKDLQDVDRNCNKSMALPPANSIPTLQLKNHQYIACYVDRLHSCILMSMGSGSIFSSHENPSSCTGEFCQCQAGTPPIYNMRSPGKIHTLF